MTYNPKPHLKSDLFGCSLYQCNSQILFRLFTSSRTNLFSFILFFFIFSPSCSSTKPKEMQSQNKVLELIYIMDPHCGWCYANAKNIDALRDEFKEQIDIDIKVGGMWLGENAPVGGTDFNQFIATHAPRMEAMTGVYLDKSFSELTNDNSYVFSSLEPSAAIVLVKALAPEKAVQFTKEVQKATFNEGKKLNVLATYLPILATLNIDKKQFEKDWLSEDNIAKTKAEFISVQGLASGFPTLLLNKDSGTQVLASGYFEQEEMIGILNGFLK